MKVSKDIAAQVAKLLRDEMATGNRMIASPSARDPLPNRMDRKAAMGFDQPAYLAGKVPDEVPHSASGMSAYPSEDAARALGASEEVSEVALRMNNPYKAPLSSVPDTQKGFEQLAITVRSAGFDSMVFVDEAGKPVKFIQLDPTGVRKPEAAFDPRKIHSRNTLSALPVAATAGAGLYGMSQNVEG